MIETYRLTKSPCVVIQPSKELKFLVYDNSDHFNLTRIVLNPDGSLLRKGYLIIPKEVAAEIAKEFLSGGTSK